MKFGMEWEIFIYQSEYVYSFIDEDYHRIYSASNKSVLFDPDLLDDLFDNFKLKLEPEWYYNEAELLTAEPKKLTYSNFLKMRNRFLDALQFISKEKNLVIPCSSICWLVNESIVSTGIHIHVSMKGLTKYLREFDTQSIFALYNENDCDYSLSVSLKTFLSALATFYKIKLNPSYRFLFSHHIWGNYRDYGYNYKRKRKFSPVNLSKPRGDKPWTIEIRVFDIEDLIHYPEQVYSIIEQIVDFTHKIIRGKLTNDDLEDASKFMKLFKRISYFLNTEVFIDMRQCIRCERFENCDDDLCDYYDSYCEWKSYITRAQKLLSKIRPKIADRIYCFDCGKIFEESAFRFHQLDGIESVIKPEKINFTEVI